MVGVSFSSYLKTYLVQKARQIVLTLKLKNWIFAGVLVAMVRDITEYKQWDNAAKDQKNVNACLDQQKVSKFCTITLQAFFTFLSALTVLDNRILEPFY